jgi:CubicO group peptidase (beta-lactamase class C family)
MTTGSGSSLAGLLPEPAAADGPGLVVGMYRDGELVDCAARGLACLEHGVRIGTRTRFELASVSKQMTAACALLLHRDGVVDLDADLRRWIPELTLSGITLGGCLHHTTGLRDYEEVNRLRGRCLAELAGLPQFLHRLAGATTANFEPGGDVAYSNTGYVAVAAALSRATGRPFGDLMRERVFAPLGMDATLLRDTVGIVVPALAFSYVSSPQAGYLRQEMPQAQVGDGAVISTVEDLARWHGFLLDGRGLGADIRQQLVEPAVLADGRRTRYGSGVILRNVNGHDVLAHSGSMYAFRSYLLSVPALGLGVTVLTNDGDVDARSIADAVLRRSLPDRVTAHAEAAPSASVPADLTWFCPETVETISSEAPGDGTLRLRTGFTDATLTWDGTAWNAADGSFLVAPATPGRLCVEDQLGRVRRYAAADPDREAAPVVPVGSYDGSELGKVLVEMVDGSVQLVVDRRRFSLERVASYEGDDVYRACGDEPLWARRHAEDGSLSIGTGNTIFPRLPASVPAGAR